MIGSIGKFAAAACAIFICVLFAGCSVGPKYQRPEATTIPESYAGNANWKVATPNAHIPKGEWWRIFGDEELNRLESEAMSANQDLKAIITRFEQARAAADISKSVLFPQVGASAQFYRTHDSLNRPVGGHPGDTYNSYTFLLDLSYELDLWGRVRHAAAASVAQAQAAADDVNSVKLSIQADIAFNYFALRALDTDKELLSASIESFRKSLELTRNRRVRGMVSDLDVAQSEAVLKNAEAQLSDSILQRRKTQNALAVLIGKNPSAFSMPEQPLATEPIILPPDLPSELLERRPDIAAAERRMAAANENIGIATAAFFPTVKIQAFAGFQSGELSDVFIWPSKMWYVGPSLSLPLFDGGQRLGALRQSEAGYDEAVARYRQTVLNAFADVENNLAAQQFLSEQFEHQAAALAATRRQLEIASNRYKSGLNTYLDVAVAQNATVVAERATTRLRGQQLVSTVALVKALGGGWQADENLRGVAEKE
jgi:outer membrane protein, multidrug efflux system